MDEPSSITAGDSASWTKVVSDYPASAGWSLAYSGQLIGAAAGSIPITIPSTGSGSTFTVNLQSSDTTTWVPGEYILTGYVSKTTDRHTVSQTRFIVLANFTQPAAGTHATRTLALIEAALEKRIPRGLENTVIDGQQLDRMPIAALVSLRAKYRAEVILERNATGARNGIKPRTSIGIRFVRP